MKSKILLVAGLIMLFITLCNEASKTDTKVAPDYDAFNKNVEVVRAFIKAHNDEDLTALSNLLADTVKYNPAVYNGNKWLDKTQMLAQLKIYHDNFENLSFVEGNLMAFQTDSIGAGFYSGSVYPEKYASNIPGGIRTYGTWTANESKSKQAVSVKYYGIINVNSDGKIVSYTDYFDVSEISNLLSKNAVTK
jgi:limonene-1,2-epoxide hydrolase